MASIHQRLARRAAAGSAAQNDVRRMLRGKRLGIKAARELARLIQEQEQQEAFAGAWVPEEWTPFYFDEEEEAEPEQQEEEAEPEQEEAPLPLFGSYIKDSDGAPLYLRSFSCVRDFCEQPFSNAQNSAVHEKRFGDGKGGFCDRVVKDDSVKMSNEEWYGGTPHANAAAARAFKGWPEGAERIRELMQNVEAPPPASLRRKTQHADQGDELDIHSVYRGSLDRAWSRKRRQSTRSRMSARIVARLGANRFTRWETMFWLGAAAAKLSELLEESSYRVEIIGASAVTVNNGKDDERFRWPTTLSTFIIKEAGSPVDLEQMAGVLCNAGFFRTYGFRGALACCPQKADEWDSKHSLMHMGLDADECVKAAELDADGTMTFIVPSEINDAKKAQEWVQKCLAALGGEEQGSAQDD